MGNINKKIIRILWILLVSISPYISNAAILSPGYIDTCGEIAGPGEYILDTDIGTSSETCLTVTSGSVTINGTSTYAVVGNIVGNKSNYDVVNTTSTGDQSIFYYDNNQADGDWANLDNWWFDSSYTETANISGVTVPSTEDQVVVDGTVSQVSSGDIDVFSARVINSGKFVAGSLDEQRLNVLRFLGGSGTRIETDPAKQSAYENQNLSGAAWIKLDSSLNSTHHTIFNKDKADGHGYRMFVTTAGTLYADFDFYTTGRIQTDAGVVSFDEWHHVATTKDGSDLALYLDGELVATGTQSGIISYGSNDFEIGRRGSYVNNKDNWGFGGYIANLAVYSDGITQEEVTSLYSTGIPDFDDPNLVSFWALDEGAGATTVYDDGPTGNNSSSVLGTSWQTETADSSSLADNFSSVLYTYFDAAGGVTFEDNSSFEDGQISTSADGNVDYITFQDNSYTTGATLYTDNLNIDTGTTTVISLTNAGDDTNIDIDDIVNSSTLTLTGDTSDLTLNNSEYLDIITGSNMDIVLNDSSRIDDMVLTSASNTITFNTDYYHGSSTPEGTLIFNGTTTLDGSVTDEDYLTVYDSNDTEITATEFNDSTTNEFQRWPYPATFNDSSTNSGIIYGNVTFNDSSTNTGTIYGNVTVNSPVSKPLGGTVNGTITYVGYSSYYYNNSAGNGDAASSTSWWSDVAFSVSASTPSSLDDVVIYGDMDLDDTPVVEYQTAEFYSGDVGNVICNLNSSTVYGTTTISGGIVGTTTFVGDQAELTGVVGETDHYFDEVISMSGASTQYGVANGIDGRSIGNMSIEFWYYLDSSDNTGSLFAWYDTSVNTPAIALFRDGSASYDFRWYVNGNYRRNETAATADAWNYIALTYDGSAWKFYINGNNTGTYTGGSTMATYGVKPRLNYGFGGSPSGKFKEFKIYDDRVLTSDEISTRYSRGVQVCGLLDDENLYAWWLFNQTSGSTVPDLSGNGYDLTLVNNPTWTTDATDIVYGEDNGTILRSYLSDTTTTRDFTENSGRWIIEANSSDIDISGATYSTSTNIFRAKLGSTFTENPSIGGGGNVVPKVVITTPTTGTTTTWNPVIDWSDADTCEYKFGSDSYTTVDCANNGSDIPKPTALTETTLYVKGTYDNTSYSEQLTTIIYDNVTAIPIDCTFTLDEASREYYYLDEDIAGTCYVTASSTIKGFGYTLTGDIVADASSTNDGSNLALQNITVTGTTSSNGTDGGNGGYITVINSVTGNLASNGGDYTGDGGDGGDITVTNSLASPLTSTITANGGSSTSCGNGGDAGTVTLTGSSYGTITNNAGEGSNDSCPGGGNTSGSRTAPSVTGQHTSQISSTPTPTTNTSPASGSTAERLIQLGIIDPLGDLNFTPITEFDTIFGNDFDEVSIGGSNFPSIFTDFQPVGGFELDPLTTNIFPSIDAFVFNSLEDERLLELTNGSGLLGNLLQSLNLDREQKIAKISKYPSLLDENEYDFDEYGLYRVKSAGTEVKSYLTYEEATDSLAQLVKVKPNQILHIAILDNYESDVSIGFQGDNILLTPTYDGYLSKSVLIPNDSGRYIVTSDQIDLDLIIDVVSEKKQNSEKPWGPFNWLWKLTH